MNIFNCRKTKIHLFSTLAIAIVLFGLPTESKSIRQDPTVTSKQIEALSRAQQPAATTQQSSEDRVELYQALLDLQNPWTVMCIAAHPDDEDGTSLIVMRRNLPMAARPAQLKSAAWLRNLVQQARLRLTEVPASAGQRRLPAALPARSAYFPGLTPTWA